MKHATAIEFLKQGYLNGELTLTESTVGEYLERIGAHIYQDFKNGYITFEVLDASLQSLNVCEDLEFGTEGIM